MEPASAAGRRGGPRGPPRRPARAGTPYRLVLTDAHMPGMSGFTLAEQIRDDPQLGNTIIMMLTSGDRPDDVARCEELGIAAYLMKPIKQSELLEATMLAMGVAVPAEADLAVKVAAASRAAAAVANPAGRGQPGQPEAGRGPAGGPRPYGHGRRQRPGGRRRRGIAALRPGADGRADARDGRAGGHDGDPRPGASQRRPRAHRRHDGPCPQGRPRSVPGGRHGRIRGQADPRRPPLRGDRGRDPGTGARLRRQRQPCPREAASTGPKPCGPCRTIRPCWPRSWKPPWRKSRVC